MAGVSIDGHACLKTMCFTGFDFRDGFAGLGYPMNVTELYWLQVNIGDSIGQQGDSMPHRCLATGRWGAARRRPDTGMARDPAPCLVLWRIDKLTWRK